MRIPVFHLDVFTHQPFRGNPAGVCALQGWLDDDTLRKVAAENNLSDTAFFVPRHGHRDAHQDKRDDDFEGGHYDLRWFTPRCEVRLCGHATLASAHVILNLLKPGLQTVRFETRQSGTLTVRKDGEMFAMDFPAMPASKLNVSASAGEALLKAIGPGPLPCDVLEVNDTYIAVYETERMVRSIRPDFGSLEQLHPFAVAVTAPGDNADFVSRYFAPSYGVPEDPVTGSAHCALTPYWAERLAKTPLYARQVSERGGELWCEMAGSRVILKGSAVLMLQGTLQF